MIKNIEFMIRMSSSQLTSIAASAALLASASLSRGSDLWVSRTGYFLGQDNVVDFVWGVGFNLTGMDPLQPRWYTQFESNWRSGGQNYQEWYLQQTLPSGQSFRPIMVFTKRDNAAGQSVIQFNGETSFIPSTDVNKVGSTISTLIFGESGKIMLGGGNVGYAVAPVEIWNPTYNESCLMLGSNAIGGLGTDVSLGFYANNGAANRPEYARVGLAVKNGGVGAEAGDVVISTRKGPSLTEKVRITSDGKLGIGTTTPKSPLHVVGLPVYKDNAAAVAANATPGTLYRTGGDPDIVGVVH